MPIILSGPSKRRLATTDNLIFSRGQSMGAAFQSALETNPVSLISENLKLKSLEKPERFVPASTRLARRRNEDELVTTTKLSKQNAVDRAQKEGFSWEGEDTTEEAFQFISDRRRSQQKRASIIEGAPTDLTQMGINFTAMLGASIVDPINIASGFIPVVGATRWGIATGKALQTGVAAESLSAIPMLAKYERFGRATAGLSKSQRIAFAGKVGLAEGAVGAVAVEPLVYTLANQLQDDYTFADSALNILIGSTLGSALHMGGTALTGRLPGLEARPNLFKTRLLDRDTPAKVREATAKTAVVQVTEGRLVDVEDILINEREMALAERLSTAQGIEREVIANRLASLSEQVIVAKRAGYLKPDDYSPKVVADLAERIKKAEARLEQIKGSKLKARVAEREKLLKTKDALTREAQYAGEIGKQVRLVEALKTGVVPKSLRREIDALINDIEIPSRAELNQRVIDRLQTMKSRADSPSLSTESKATMDEVNTVDLAPETVETRTQSSADERTALQEDAEAAGVEWETPEIKAAEQAETDLNVSIQRAADYIACRKVHG